MTCRRKSSRRSLVQPMLITSKAVKPHWTSVNHATCWVMLLLVFFTALLQNCAAQAVGGLPDSLQTHLYQLPSVATAQATLNQPTRFQFRSAPLGDVFANIAAAKRITIWLDRRLDPGYPLTYQARGTDLGTALQQIARLAGAEIQLVENVVYVGPKGCGARIAAAAAVLYDAMHLDEIPSANVALPLQWETLATPTELLKSTASKGRMAWDGRLPHDLLRAGEFQRPSSLATCLALICGGHEQMPLLSHKQSIRCEPLFSTQQWAGRYALSSLNNAQVQQLRRKFSAVEVHRDGDQWVVTGDASVHLAIGNGVNFQERAHPGPGQLPRNKRNSETRLSGDIAGTVENVATQLAKMQGIEVVWDAACTATLRQKLVSFHVDKATFGEIVESFSTAAGMQIELDETKMKVAP